MAPKNGQGKAKKGTGNRASSREGWSYPDLETLKREHEAGRSFADISQNFFTNDNGFVRHDRFQCKETWDVNFGDTDENDPSPRKKLKRATNLLAKLQAAKEQHDESHSAVPGKKSKSVSKRKRATEEKDDDEPELEEPVKKPRSASKSKAANKSRAAADEAEDEEAEDHES